MFVGCWQGLVHVLVIWKLCWAVVARYNHRESGGPAGFWPRLCYQQQVSFDDPLQLATCPSYPHTPATSFPPWQFEGVDLEDLQDPF